MIIIIKTFLLGCCYLLSQLSLITHLNSLSEGNNKKKQCKSNPINKTTTAHLFYFIFIFFVQNFTPIDHQSIYI